VDECGKEWTVGSGQCRDRVAILLPTAHCPLPTVHCPLSWSAVFRIKICGITTVEDASSAVQLGADMIGLNFYPASPRYVSPEQAEVIASEVSQTTGVFVNESAEQINRIADDVRLGWVQLHGDEPAELLADIRSDLPIIRVRCLDDRGLAAVAEDLEACRKHGREPAAILVDATVSGQYGGTGKTANWPALEGYGDWLGEVPLILAGGLNPDNVSGAISEVSPAAVDTASGVETEPGVKSASKMRSFIEAAGSAFASLEERDD